MSTVTARELQRRTAAVLDKAKAEGGVIVRRPDGTRFRIQAEPAAPARKKPKWPDFAARQARISAEPTHPDIFAAVDKMIRGE